ncbi:hypothetical protein L1987_15560 [Smallanthus sonchifolius]|uniref:Uncharacterized protein n=1 Tax=Smallanthus sonchifolius TaxID=185202 RepID=A0ACB9J9D7_9ASTR|nr:hypothetical protein L1987_15560 [Smallanthus sonchifolius]
MRRSFGPKMGGGGGAGGGGMIKTVHRAVRAGIGGGELYSHTATRTTGNRNHPTLSLTSNTNPSSPPCSYLNHPATETPPHKWAFTASPAASEEFDWEYIDDGGSDGDGVKGFYDDLVFGGVPSQEEVHHAVSSLHEVLEPVSFAQLMKNRRIDDDEGVEMSSSPTSFQKDGFELDWTEPSMQLCHSTSALQVPSSDKVFDAFHLLQTEPSVQRMVISLSSDKAVWDAVMNNEAVRELRESVKEDKSIYDGLEDGANDSNPVAQVLRWIFANTKDRVIEIVEKITKVVNELVRPMSKDEKPKGGLDSFDEKLRSSFFLSIVVLLIVIVSRSGKC